MNLLSIAIRQVLSGYPIANGEFAINKANAERYKSLKYMNDL